MSALLLALGLALAGAVWLAAGVAGASKRRSRTARTVDDLDLPHKVLRIIIVLAWLYAVIPSLLGVVSNGRKVASTLAEAAPPSALGGLLATLLSSAIGGLCALLVWIAYQQKGERSPSKLLLYFAPAIGFVLVNIGDGVLPGRQAYLYPLLGFALWLTRPKLTVFKLVGTFTVATAAIAIVMQIAVPDLAYYANPGGAISVDKAIIGSRLLAGPLSHPNVLGAVLAFGAPAILLFRTVKWRVIGGLLIGYTLLATASRTAIIGVLVAALVCGLCSQRRNGTRPTSAAWVALVVGAFMMLWTPLTATSMTAFSGRGQIWIASRSFVSSRPWFGYGDHFFSNAGQYQTNLGTYAFTGHNLLVDSLLRIGIVGFAVYGVWIVFMMAAAVRMSAFSLFGVAWVISLVFQSWLEARLVFGNLGQLGIALWFPICAILFARPDEVSGGDAELGEVEHAGAVEKERAAAGRLHL